MKLEVVTVQFDIALGDPQRNHDRVTSLLNDYFFQRQETGAGATVTVLPELWDTAYDLERIDQIADYDAERCRVLMSAMAKSHNTYIVAGSVAKGTPEGVYNTTLVFDPEGKVLGEYSKIHRFGLMDEDQYLEAGQQRLTFDLAGTRCGSIICYDLRFPELARSLALAGSKVLFVPAQWPQPRLTHWRLLNQARAVENQLYVVAVNTIGTRKGDTFFGHSMVVDPWGEICYEAGEGQEVQSTVIDLDLVDQVRETIPVFADRQPQLYTTGDPA